MKRKKKVSSFRFMLWVLHFNFVAIPIFLLVCLAPSCPNKTPDYYITEGDKLAAEGKNLDAIKYYTKAIKDSPNNSVAYGNRARTWLKEDSMDRAVADYEKVVQLHPSGETYFLLAESIWKSASGRDSLACKYWKIAKEVYNHNKSWDRVRENCKK